MTAILYSYNECPFCARSIAALKYAQLDIELRGVDLYDLPTALTNIDAKASVPYLILDNQKNIDESWDIVKWALDENDPELWLGDKKSFLLDAEMLIETNDSFFVPALYAYRESSQPENNREDCEEYLEELEEMLEEQQFLIADQLTLADIGVAPFIRLMSQKEPEWFAQAPYPKLRAWLSTMLETKWLKTALRHHNLWNENDPIQHL